MSTPERDILLTSRKKLFLDALLRLKRDVPMPLAEFVALTGFNLIRDGKDGPQTELDLTERVVRWTVREVEDKIRPLEVTFPAGGIIVKLGQDTAFKRRLKRAEATKRAMGRALWDFLLGPSWKGPDRADEPSVLAEGFTLSPRLKAKVQTLRRRNQLFFAADGGTSTLAVIQELLTAERIPFEVQIDEHDQLSKDKSNLRLVEPVLLTNSIPIVQAVGESSHQYSFIVELIGGIARAGRDCTTGELTDLWLKLCCADGKFGLLDLAIIGATGVYMGPDGIPMASCDDREEASLKMKLLEMAGGYGQTRHSGGLRVLVFHAAKLLYPEARCRFAALTKEMVDIVVIDDGLAPEDPKDGVSEEQKCVADLVKSLQQCGVDVLLVKNQGR